MVPVFQVCYLCDIDGKMGDQFHATLVVPCEISNFSGLNPHFNQKLGIINANFMVSVFQGGDLCGIDINTWLIPSLPKWLHTKFRNFNVVVRYVGFTTDQTYIQSPTK